MVAPPTKTTRSLRPLSPLATIASMSRFADRLRFMQPALELIGGDLPFPSPPDAQGIDQGQKFMELGVFPRRLRCRLIQGRNALAPNLAVVVRPNVLVVGAGDDLF